MQHLHGSTHSANIDLSIPPFLDRRDPPVTRDGALIPPQVLTLTRRIKALIEKGDRAAEKAEQFYKAAGIHIKEIKQQQPDHWEAIVREKCALGRSRSYELIAIADGKTTLEKVRDRSNRSSKISHAKKSAVQRTCSSRPKAEPVSVTDPPVTESPRRITQSAENSIEEHRAAMTHLDEPEPYSSAYYRNKFVDACEHYLCRVTDESDRVLVTRAWTRTVKTWVRKS
jgi:hypothetical protein